MRRTLTTSLAIALAAAALPAQAIRYAPGQYRYAIVDSIKRSDVRGDAKQSYTIVATQAMAVLLTPRGSDSLRVRYTLEKNRLRRTCRCSSRRSRNWRARSWRGP